MGGLLKSVSEPQASAISVAMSKAYYGNRLLNEFPPELHRLVIQHCDEPFRRYIHEVADEPFFGERDFQLRMQEFFLPTVSSLIGI